MSSFQPDLVVPQKWYGFDFNRTLAHYTSYGDDMAQAEPILPMLEKLRCYLREGKTCKIMSASVWYPRYADYLPTPDTSLAWVHERDAYKTRASHTAARIKAWCLQHVGQELEVTCEIDPGCQEIWNDKAWHVVPNMGLTPGAPYVDDLTLKVADARRVLRLLALELPEAVYRDASARINAALDFFPDSPSLGNSYPRTVAESFPADSTAQPDQTPGAAGDTAQLPADAGHDAPPPAG